MFKISANRFWLLAVALTAALFAGGCLGMSDNPKPHVIRSKVAKTPPPQPAAKDNTRVAKKTAPKTEKAKKSNAPSEDTTASAEPDKLLYERSMKDIKKGHYTEARLSLQALINTYPDSEYLAKAKLAIGDSFYKEGGTSNLTQAVEEYKNFIIFFPFLDEAAYAQLQVGMAHYRMMEKSDRDTTNAQAAEDDYQTFLLKYPQSPLAPQAEQRLRDVQEVLADGEFKIGRFYYIKQDYPASAARLTEVADRYPLYSQSDDAIWMLGDVYERARLASKNEDMKNHFADLAAKCYDRIVTSYPLSKHDDDAKARLKSMGLPIPKADSAALARMEKQQTYEKNHHELAIIRLPKDMLHSGPDVSDASRSGAPNLAPPTDAISASDVLKPGNEGPTFSMGAQPTSADPSNTPDASASGGTEEASQGVSAEAAAANGNSVGGRIIAAPTTDTPAASSTSAPSGSNPPAGSSATDNNSNSDNNSVPILNPTTTPPASTNASTPGTGSTTPDSGATSSGAVPANANPPGTGSPQPAQATPPGQQPAPANAQSNSASQNGTKTGDKADSKADSKADPKTESSSKKKKGLRKLVPW